jgi:hypothetical protein
MHFNIGNCVIRDHKNILYGKQIEAVVEDELLTFPEPVVLAAGLSLMIRVKANVHS